VRWGLVGVYVLFILMELVFFFICLFLHFFKGLFFSSFRLNLVWVLGVLILLAVMLVAFMGYVLVWAQISYWARVVITRLLRVFPFFGDILVSFIWGGFMVSDLTLKFFFSLHFFIALGGSVVGCFSFIVSSYKWKKVYIFWFFVFFIKLIFFQNIGGKMDIICYCFYFFCFWALFFHFHWVIQRCFWSLILWWVLFILFQSDTFYLLMLFYVLFLIRFWGWFVF